MSDPPAPSGPAPERPPRPQLRAQPHPPSHLPTGWRVFFVVAGWVLVLVGIAGLALPGIQGVLTILLGAALLSVASETAYWVLRAVFRRWPRGWRKLETARRRIYRRIVGPGGPPPGETRWGPVRRLVRRRPGEPAPVPTAWRLLPLLLLAVLVTVAVLLEVLHYRNASWTTKVPVVALLLVALVRRRGAR